MPRAAQPKHDSPITFTLQETARICGFDPQRLRQWISEGLLNPAVRGGRGPGNGHRFTPQQMIGLAMAWSFAPKRCPTEVAIGKVNGCAKWKWSVVEHMLALNQDEFTEEAWAQVRGPRSGVELDDEDRDRCRRLKEHLCEISDAVRARLRQAEDGTDGRQLDKSLPDCFDPELINKRFNG